jgi:hypothetical protein
MVCRAEIQGAFKVVYGLVEILIVLRPAVSREKTMSGIRL